MKLQLSREKISYPTTEWVMSVVCIGRCGLLDEFHERQRFETALGQEGFLLEAFTLQVNAANDARSDAAGQPRYDVKVTHAPTQTVKAYRGGAGGDWVARFAEDLAAGLYGQPDDVADPRADRRSA